jgi:hypothetical protein
MDPRANKEEESDATKPASERLNGSETGKENASQENGGRVLTEEQGREGKFAADSNEDEKESLVTRHALLNEMRRQRGCG